MTLLIPAIVVFLGGLATGVIVGRARGYARGWHAALRSQEAQARLAADLAASHAVTLDDARRVIAGSARVFGGRP